MNGDEAARVGPSGVTTFAALVQRWRHTANLTQEGLAERSGLSPRSIQNLESGRVSRPRRDSVRLLADALGLTGRPRAEFEHAARLGTPTPITEAASHRGVQVTMTVTAADNLRQLMAQAGREGWRPVDLRGLATTADPEEVLVRLLTALGVGDATAVSIAV
jgi:transcriptional regulator with XRE-family HTH domain